MFSHGTGTSVTDDSTTGQIDNYFTYVGDSKCAVFDCNGIVVGSGTVEGMNLGSPIAVQAFHKAYEYIIRRYNVRKDLIVGGNSQGGLTALNFVNSYPNIVRCIVLAYPVTSLKGQAWDDPWRSEVKPAIASAYNFSDTTGETWEADKVVGYDPINNRAVTVGDEHRVFLPVPIKIWHGSADTVVAYQGSVDYINSVKSAGIPAYLRTISGGTHGAASVTNAFYREAKYFIRRFL
jgi:predicted esterase